MAEIFTVGQINTYIHDRFASDRKLKNVSVKGELSNVKYHQSGHIYFTLKDSISTLSAVMFSSKRVNLKDRLTDGQEVVVTGNIETFVRDGRYQIYAEYITGTGEGALYEKYERLKAEFEEMGMFSAQYKRPVPAFVRTLGVVTAPTGAAVRDIIDVSRRRFPYIQIILYPAKVQGDGAAQSIADGIRALDEYGVDCIIAGRGGGSIEDLWAFNEETVARAIFDCGTPLISAVGHETDTTIADFVADLRAPTPSAAAEIAVFDYFSFNGKCSESAARLNFLMRQRLVLAREKCSGLKALLESRSPQGQLSERRIRLDSALDKLQSVMENKIYNCKRQIEMYLPALQGAAAGRIAEKRKRLEILEPQLHFLMENMLKDKRHMVEILASKLNGVSPLLKLTQGYCVIENNNGEKISDIDSLKTGDDINIYLKNGNARAKVTQIKKYIQ